LLRVDDDDEMNDLASSALPSYPELVALIADLSERVAAREQALKVKVWDWSNATDEQQQKWLEELDVWMHHTLFARWPEYRHPKRVPVCWREHSQSVEALSSLYWHWWKAYVRKVDEDLTGWWQDKWLETLTARAQRAASQCGSIYARPGLPHIHPFDREYHALVEERYGEKRPYPMPQRVVADMPTREPNPIPLTFDRQRGEGRDQGWGQGTTTSR
jgi:hypothetical protein